METETYGEAPSQQPYDDLDRVSDLTSLPDSAFHRDVDKIVLGASSHIVKTAVICPPTIYGAGRGPGNQRSRHVYDLSDLFVLLTEAAVANKPDLDDKLWGKEGYF